MLKIINGYFLDPKSGKEGYYDIEIQQGKVIGIYPGKESEQNVSSEKVGNLEQMEVIDARGCIVAPGLVDVHTHFRDPGFTYKEDLLTGAAAGAHGGYTSLVGMANTRPALSTPEDLAYVLEKVKGAPIHVYTCSTITEGMEGKTLCDLRELAKAGAVGFTDDGLPIMDEKLVLDAMRLAKELNKPLSFHEEDPAYITNPGVNAGEVAASMGLEGANRQAEIVMVERDLRLALETGAAIDIQHVSAAESVALVREAKRRGGDIHCEATPHHFSLTESAVLKHGTLAKMNPPLRTEADRQAIIEGLQDGTIDIIATDHAPHSTEEKKRPFTEAPSGITGLETALGLGVEKLVKTGKLTIMELIRKMSYNPANLYHLDAGYLAEGGPADVVIFNPDEAQKVGEFLSKSSNSPFWGEKLSGKIHYVVCNGKVVYRYC